ncbi:MAG: hypothetical protein WCP35_10345 [Verrucomicrobiota bacterium]
MKPLSILLAFICSAIGQNVVEPSTNINLKNPAGASKVSKEFRVSKIGVTGATEKRQKFLQLWSLLQNDSGANTYTLSINQVLKPDNGMFLYIAAGSGNPRELGTIAVLLKKKDLLESDSVTVTLKRVGIWDGVNAGGAASRLPYYKEVEEAEKNPNLPTREEFLERIKLGETFTVVEKVEGGCYECMGNGDMGAMHKNKVCVKCQGSGNAAVTWTLKW